MLEVGEKWRKMLNKRNWEEEKKVERKHLPFLGGNKKREAVKTKQNKKNRFGGGVPHLNSP